MSRILLSDSARDDRREITAFTVEHFGIRQARKLRDQFHVALKNLAASPLMGRTHDEFDPPGRSFRYYLVMRAFVVVYEPTTEGIRVARLLHVSRSLSTELDRDTGDDA